MKMKQSVSWVTVLAVLFFVLASAISASAQNATRPPLTNDDVIQMVKANLSESLILGQISDSATSFDFSPAELIRLSTSGVSDTLIAAMEGASEPVVSRQVQPGIAPIVQPPPAAVAPPSAQTPRQAAVASLTQNRSHGLRWTGVAVLGVGVTMVALSYTALRQSDSACGYLGTKYTCFDELSVNKPLSYGGMGATVAGIAMWVIGEARHVPVRPSINIGRGFGRVTFTRVF